MDAPRRAGYTEEGSCGAISERHWTRLRKDSNREALEYYRQRSRAPGVAEGGSWRNFYCMECDGVIPHEPAVERCPHCGAAIERGIRRYFNWVESDFPRRSDLGPILPWVLGGLLLLGLLGGLAWWAL